MTGADEVVARMVGERGPLPFSTVVDVALYDPVHGFYAAGGQAGRRGDFITSPEVGPLFGAVLARALDAWWDELGRPDPFVVAEAGAGRGALAIAVRAAAPACAAALTYVLVERSDVLRASQAEHLPLGAMDQPGPGPRFASVASLDRIPAGGASVVVANELLDNIAFDVLARAEGRWWEVRVDAPGAQPPLVEVLAPAAPDVESWATAAAPGAAKGARIPRQRAAAAWVADALSRIGRGRLVVIDYGVAATAELAARPPAAWLRTYRGHDRGGDPLVALGSQDITCDVCIDQLAGVGPPTTVARQADVLRAHGIDELVEEGRRRWGARASVGDLDALRARSRVREADALVDPAGLGSFVVAEWVVDAGDDPG